MVTTYRELEVWQVSMRLVIAVYDLCRDFPPSEQYGLTSQLQRAAISIPSNIAEGWGRSHRGDYLHHLSIARGSLMEIETQLILAVRLNFTTRDRARVIWELAQSVGKMLTVMIEKMHSPNAKRQAPPTNAETVAESTPSYTTDVFDLLIEALP